MSSQKAAGLTPEEHITSRNGNAPLSTESSYKKQGQSHAKLQGTAVGCQNSESEMGPLGGAKRGH